MDLDPKSQAEAAAQCSEEYWATLPRKWLWMRQKSLIPVYTTVGEMIAALLRRFPEIQDSNDATWFTREVRDTPAVYVLFPEEFSAQVKQRGFDLRAVEGKNVVSFLYLGKEADTESSVNKTLLASTAQDQPFYTAQLAHELLNCFCASSWDGQIMRSGLRTAHWRYGPVQQRYGNFNDLLLDILLVDFLPGLPAGLGMSIGSLLESAQGPYWQIITRFHERIPRAAITAALFSTADDARSSLRTLLDSAFGGAGTASAIDKFITQREWDNLQTLIG